MFVHSMNRVKRLDSAMSVIYTLASHTVYHTPILHPTRPYWFIEIREHEIIVRNTEIPTLERECPSGHEVEAKKWNQLLCAMSNISGNNVK